MALCLKHLKFRVPSCSSALSCLSVGYVNVFLFLVVFLFASRSFVCQSASIRLSVCLSASVRLCLPVRLSVCSTSVKFASYTVWFCIDLNDQRALIYAEPPFLFSYLLVRETIRQ